MTKEPHDFARQSTVGIDADPVWRFTCGECNWTHLIATPGAPPVQQCPWCGCEEIEPRQAGAFASFICSVHGRVTCVMTEDHIHAEDYMDLFCPHCRVISQGKPASD
jgi:hypothetical protein